MKSWREHTKQRLRTRKRLREDPQFRALFIQRCRRDPVFFINEVCDTYDPRLPSMQKWQPFVLWPKQVEFIEWLHARYKAQGVGVVLKTRDFGFSWMSAAFALWLFLFEPDAAIIFGSRKQELVDKLGDPKTLFYKIRQLLYRMPRCMMPAGFDRKQHDNWLRIINPANGTTITGEGGDNMGRGGRGSIYFVDEFATVQHQESVQGAVEGNADCVIYGSTPDSPTDVFADLCKRGKQGLLPLFKATWRDDPRKDDAWRQRKLASMSSDRFAKEYETKFGDASGLVYAQLSRARNVIAWEHDPSLPTYVSVDWAADMGSIGLWQPVGGGAWVRYHEILDKDTHAHKMALQVAAFAEQLLRAGSRMSLHGIGRDPAGRGRDQSRGQRPEEVFLSTLRAATVPGVQSAPLFPDVYLCQVPPVARDVLASQELVKMMICDGLGNARLFWAESLVDRPPDNPQRINGWEAMQGLRKDPNTGKGVKDGVHDHSADEVRQAVAQFMRDGAKAMAGKRAQRPQQVHHEPKRSDLSRRLDKALRF